jgi:hypothetical protein
LAEPPLRFRRTAPSIRNCRGRFGASTVVSMLLFASSNHAAHAVARALEEADIRAGVGRERDGRFPVSVLVADDRDAEVLDIATAVDPAIQGG